MAKKKSSKGTPVKKSAPKKRSALAKKNAPAKISTVPKASCTWTGCKKGDWLWTLVSELALYGFLFYTMRFLGAAGNLWVNSLILLVLANIFWFACPVIRKHFYCK